MERPRWMIWAFVAAQLALPTMGVWLRYSGGPTTNRFGWQMFSTMG